MEIGAMTFEGSILLMIAIIFGLVAAVITYMNSRKLKGEVFEVPFVYLAFGIFFATFSLIDVTFFQNFFSETVVILIHDISFIVGLVLIFLASVKITKYLRSLENFDTKLSK